MPDPLWTACSISSQTRAARRAGTARGVVIRASEARLSTLLQSGRFAVLSASLFPLLQRLDMPTVLRKGGFHVVIYVNDHEPPHVHARQENAVVIVNLGVQGGAPSLRSAKHASAKVQRAALQLVAEHNGFLVDEWRRIHG